MSASRAGSESRLPVACNRDCGGGCPLLATVEGGRVVHIADNPAGGAYLKGCIRGYQAWRQQQAPGRLTTPLVRTGPRGSGQFRETGWDEALARVADGLAAVRERHGDGAILALGGSGSCRGAVHNTAELLPRFLNLIGGGVEESSTYSSAASAYVERVVLGTRKAGVDPATLRHSGMIVLWGANLVDCIMGCEWRARVREAKRRGVPVVVIDPRRTTTARQLGTEWLPVRPGTDSALMLAILHVWVTDRTVDEAFVAAHATGFEALRRRVLGAGGGPGSGHAARSRPGKAGASGSGDEAARGAAQAGAALVLEPGQAATPEWAEGVCGVPAARIVALAREWARRRPVALIPGLSIQRTMGGEEAVRLAIALQLASGDLGRLGGSSGSQTWNGLPKPRLRGMEAGQNPSGVSLPVNDWADAVLRGRTGGYPVDIRAAYNVGGNYVAQGADVAKSIRAMDALEFSVCHELFLTATAQYCDVVLPVTHWLERADIVYTTANYLLFSHKVAEPPGQARDDYDVFSDLAGRMGCSAAFTEGRDADAWLRAFVASSEIADEEEFRRTGLYLAADQERVGLADFAADPEAHPLATPSGKVELAGPACVAAGLSEVPEARVLMPAPTPP
ncbi:MAG: molybdopterin-dependent oxidoreductase, partial [Thermoleophilia bacterium]|nr:molybdopterin-dependent oxidoreductase [Thermoleophilia bacterium]